MAKLADGNRQMGIWKVQMDVTRHLNAPRAWDARQALRVSALPCHVHPEKPLFTFRAFSLMVDVGLWSTESIAGKPLISAGR